MRRGFALAGVAVLGLAMAEARAQNVDPWSVGVTDDQKMKAQSLLEDGNARFLASDWTGALALYTEAVAVWDHPAIRFNMVRCLIQLERHVEAYDNLKLALQYGAAPLEDAVYTEALSYEKLLKNEISELIVACQQPGVEISLDGKPLLTCPGEQTQRLTPGQHQVVGEKAGYLTQTLDVVVVGGASQAVDVTLMELTKAAVVRHRWEPWKPWAVFIGGATVAGLGGLVQLKASSDLDSYERAVGTQCVGDGCTAEELESIAGLEDSALLENKIAISLIVVGGATLVTGGVMLWMNRGETVYPEDDGSLRVSGAPLPGGGGAMTVSGRF